MDVRPFFDYARSRYLVMIAKDQLSGVAKGPWSRDDIIRTYRFCNIFREDDRTTRWFKVNIREPYRERGVVVLATIIFRWFNRISTGEVLNQYGLMTKWNPETAMCELRHLSPLVTGAYMIKTPAKMTKLEGLCWCINTVWAKRYELVETIDSATTLQAAHQHLMQFPFLGPFMAYEVVTDLRHTALLEDATDILTWASAGPGAARGLGRILTGDTGQFNYNSGSHQEEMLREMRNLLTVSKDPKRWPAHWPDWEMREVEHTLCEFDKYERVRLGEGTPKQRYTPCTS